MGCIGSPATATTRPPRNGPIHRQVRVPSKSDCAVVDVTMACAPSSPALVLLLTAYPPCGEHPSMLTRQCQRASADNANHVIVLPCPWRRRQRRRARARSLALFLRKSSGIPWLALRTAAPVLC